MRERVLGDLETNLHNTILRFPSNGEIALDSGSEGVPKDDALM